MAESKRWSRREAVVGLPPIDTWPTMLIDHLEPAEQESIRQKIEALKKYVDGLPVAEIAETTGVGAQLLPYLLRRCLGVAEDGRIMGFRALQPYIRLKSHKRKAKIVAKFQEQRGGMSGALSTTLSRFPGIEKTLASLIRKEAKRLLIPEHRIRPKDLHRIFLNCLKEHGVQPNEWPFNTKFLGVRSIQRHMESFLDEHFDRAVITREERPARAHLATGGGKQSLLSFNEPFEAVELDSYRINAFFTVVFQTPEGTEVDVLLDRLWLLAIIDRASSAVLAYGVIYSSEVSADDVLKVIRNAATQKWQPKTLTIPGLTYPANGGLPSGVFEECSGAQWSVIMLDGALAHLAKSIHHTARQKLGFIVNWGPVGHFERRPNVERLFKQISDDIFMRLPSTTGCNPGNGRAENAEENAVRYHIRAKEVEEMLDVVIAQYNATPTEGLSFHSPLDYIRFYLETHSDHFLVRHLPASITSPGISIFPRRECVVRGGRKDGRRPYIELDRARYTSSLLANTSGLIGQKLIVEIDEDDYRQVHAFLPNGNEVGFLSVQGKWAKSKHSRKTRIAINRLCNKRLIVLSEFDDPVQVYMKYVSAAAGNKTHVEHPGPSPRDAMEAARVAQESSLPLTIVPPDTPPTEIKKEPLQGGRDSGLIDRPLPDLNKLINRQR
ncbi:MAG: hypothetical protein KGZ62_06140 [Sulfurimonas sp.]|nr:hypothetical protein [Sulfurimonas sp.]